MGLFKRFFAAALAASMLLLAGCSAVIGGSGTLSLKADDVSEVEITNGILGNRFTVQDRKTISTLIQHINSFTLENGQAQSDSHTYTLSLKASSGEIVEAFVIVDEASVAYGEQRFDVNAKQMLKYVEGLECDTLTDKELLQRLFESSYWDDISITNEDGQLSIDKLLGLTDQFPALVELVSRPTAIQSVSTEGITLLKQYLTSDNETWKQRAQAIAQLLEELLPQVKEQVENLLETAGN